MAAAAFLTDFFRVCLLQKNTTQSTGTVGNLYTDAVGTFDGTAGGIDEGIPVNPGIFKLPVQITHNRESEDGVLKIEFYTEASMTMAGEILKEAGYSATVRL